MTQAEKAKKGVLTPTLKKVARDESMDPEKLAGLVAEGLAVIPFNPAHAPARPAGIGRGLRTKVNASIGSSSDICDLAAEIRKAEEAWEKAGKDATR